MTIVILGAGPAGLGAAYYLYKSGDCNWSLFERNSHVGGLSASFIDRKGLPGTSGGMSSFPITIISTKLSRRRLGANIANT